MAEVAHADRLFETIGGFFIGHQREARVADQRIHFVGLQTLGKTAHARERTQIEFGELRFASGKRRARNRRFAGARLPAREDHPGACACERRSGRFTDAGVGTGDDDRFAGKVTSRDNLVLRVGVRAESFFCVAYGRHE